MAKLITTSQIIKKRARKQTGMAQEIPGPTLYGPKDAETTFICWGSTYGPLRETVDRLNAEKGGQANMLHFNGLHPFPLDATEQALAKATPPTGQPTRYKPTDKLLDFLNGL